MAKYIMTEKAYEKIRTGGKKDSQHWLNDAAMVEYINSSFGLIHHINEIEVEKPVVRLSRHRQEI